MEPCFNSTLVQLKEPSDASAKSIKICFNSTLVQLKATLGRLGKVD